MQVYDNRPSLSRRLPLLGALLLTLLPAWASPASGAPALATGVTQEEEPAPARELFRRALEEAQANRYDEARRLALQGLELRPNDADGRNLLGEILEQTGDLDGAAEAYRRAARDDPAWVTPLRNLGRMELAREQYEVALEALESAVELTPADPALHAWIGLAHRGRGLVTNAREAFDTAWSLDPDSMELAVDVALARAAAGDPAGAIAAAERAVELGPGLPGPLMLLGDVLARSPELEDRIRAPAAFRRAAGTVPGDPTPWLRLERTYTDLALHGEAETALRRAIELGADDAGIWLRLGRSIVAQSRPADAIEAYDRALEQIPDDPTLHLERGQALFNANRHEEAIAEVQRAIELAEEPAEAYLTGARILMVMGELDEAAALAEQAVASGFQPLRSRLTLGRLRIRQGQHAEAVAPLERVVAAAPELIEASYLLGQALVATGERERGQRLLAEYQEALREQGSEASDSMRANVLDRARVHIMRGRVFLAEDRLEEARGQLEAAAELNPEMDEIWRLLAATYERLGMAAEAAEARARIGS